VLTIYSYNLVRLYRLTSLEEESSMKKSTIMLSIVGLSLTTALTQSVASDTTTTTTIVPKTQGGQSASQPI